MQKIINFIKENKSLTLILLIATFLRFYKINFQSLWMDEIYTMNITNPENSFGTIITEVNNREGFPYLYFLLLKILHTIFGFNPIVTRSLSALLGVLSVFAINKLGEKLYNKKAGLYAAAILAFSEYSIYISQDARPYTFYLFFIIISYIGLVEFIKNPTQRNAIKYGVYIGLLLNFNFFGFINVFAQVISLGIIFSKTNFSDLIKIVKNLIISGVIALVLFIPNIFKLNSLMSFKSSWIPAPTNETLGIILKEFLGNSEITLFLFTAVFIYFIFIAFNNNEDNLTKINLTNNEFSFIIITVWVSVFLIVIYLKTYLDTSLYISRYFTSIIPAIFIIFGISLSNIRSVFIKYLFLISICIFMFMNLTIARGHYRGPNKTQFREASEFIIEYNKTNEPVFTGLKYWFDYYLGSKFNVVEKPNLESLINEMMANPNEIKAFWYTDAHGRPYQLSDQALQFVNNNFYIESSFDGFDAWTKHFILIKDAKRNIDLSKFPNLQTYNGTPFAYNIELFETNDNLIKVNGWAYFDKQDAKDSRIDIVLLKDNQPITMMTQKVNRPDVTSYFKSEYDLSNSGFSATINTNDLKPGEYKIAIYLENKIQNKIGLNISDKTYKK